MIRGLERAFVLKWLGVPPKRVLDVGCGKTFPLFRKEGFELWGVDVLPCSDDPHFRQEDARQMSFPDGFFDVVYSVSAIEHVGLRRYGDEDDVESGDRLAIQEMGRVLKPEGIMVVTLPAGHPDMDWIGRHRLYDDTRVDELLRGFRILEKEYLIKRDGWRRSSMPEISAYTEGRRKWLANVNVAALKGLSKEQKHE